MVGRRRARPRCDASSAARSNPSGNTARAGRAVAHPAGGGRTTIRWRRAASRGAGRPGRRRGRRGPGPGGGQIGEPERRHRPAASSIASGIPSETAAPPRDRRRERRRSRRGRAAPAAPAPRKGHRRARWRGRRVARRPAGAGVRPGEICSNGSAQALPTGRQDREVGARTGSAATTLRTADELVFAVVDHEQPRATGQHLGERGQRVADVAAEADRDRYRGQHRGGSVTAARVDDRDLSFAPVAAGAPPSPPSSCRRRLVRRA